MEHTYLEPSILKIDENENINTSNFYIGVPDKNYDTGQELKPTVNTDNGKLHDVYQYGLDSVKVTKNEEQPIIPKKMKRSLSKHEVPNLFHNPHVEFGFRPLHQPWSYYIMSIFSLHNEFMNVWTHLISLFLMILKIHHFSKELDFFNDPYTWPLLTGMSCGVIVFLCSTVAHCCHSKSEFVHYVFFMIDYSGIAIYALGSAILMLTYCTEDEYFYVASSYFYPFAVSLPILICFCSTISKVKNASLDKAKQKVLKIVPVTLTYILFNSPVIYRVLNCYLLNINCDESIPHHFKQIVMFSISGLFFASEIPQRWRPGKHDIFMHSHQLFHIAVAVCILTNMDGVFVDFQMRESVIRKRPTPTILSVINPVITVISLEILCIIYFAREIYSNRTDHGKIKKE